MRNAHMYGANNNRLYTKADMWIIGVGNLFL